jgi:hypothetical protein
MGKRLAASAIALVLVLALFVALQPAEFRVERSATIAAPAAAIQGHIEDLRAMEAWSPFAKMDPAQRNTYAGPPSGVGATCAWEGGRAGRGRMTVVATQPEREVELRLEFFEPMEATNRARFTLAPAAGGTRVTWSLEGTNGYLAKAAALVMDMDEMVGGEFEKGLAALAALVEAPSHGG